MEIGLQFQIIYRDHDLVEVRVSVWNGAFGGSGDVYVNTGELAELATRLHGFPSTPSDSRDLMLGAFGHESAGAGLRMKFHCVDGAGRAYVEAEVQSGDDIAGTRQSVVLSLPIEASAIDEFVDELSGLENAQCSKALLKGRISDEHDRSCY